METINPHLVYFFILTFGLTTHTSLKVCFEHRLRDLCFQKNNLGIVALVAFATTGAVVSTLQTCLQQQ
jgi:hypothetical protein